MSNSIHPQTILDFHRWSMKRPGRLTDSQARANGLVSSFVDHATDGYSLAAMVGGGLVYRLGRVGTLALGSRLVGAYGRTPLHLLIRPASVTMGFGAEVFTFEAGQRALRIGIGGADPNLLRWSGENGLGRGLVGAAITLGSLKGTGALVNGQNPVLQHLFQDSAMVLAHNVHDRIFTRRGDSHPTAGGQAPIAPTLAEQFIEAEATLWQMSAGMALVHGAFPTLGQVERSLDLSVRTQMSPSPLSLSLEGEGARRAGEGVSEPLPVTPSGTTIPNSNIFMATLFPGSGRGAKGRSSHEGPDLVTHVSEAMSVLRRSQHRGKEMVLRVIEGDLERLSSSVSEGERQEVLHRLRCVEWFFSLHHKYGIERLFVDQLIGLFSGQLLFWGPLPREYWYPAGPRLRPADPLEYSPQAQIWLASLRWNFGSQAALRADSLSRERLLESRVDENPVNRIWFYQLLKFAQELGALLAPLAPEDLLRPFDERGAPGDENVLSRALLMMREEGVQEEEGMQVFQLTIPYGEVIFGQNRKGMPRVYFSLILQQLERFLKGSVHLVEAGDGSGPLVVRIPSLSLLERLSRAVQGDDAVRFDFVKGEIPQHLLMARKEEGIAPIGIVRDPLLLGDNDAVVPPWVFTFHDVYHAFNLNWFSSSFRRYAARVYRGLRENPWGPAGWSERHRAKWADFETNPARYLNHSLYFLREGIEEDLEKHRFDPRRLEESQAYLRGFLDLLRRTSPANDEEMQVQLQWIAGIEALVARMERLQRAYRRWGIWGLRFRLRREGEF